MTLLAISLVAGALTVLSPCVLPLLPIIVGGSLAGGANFRRALTVTISLGASVFLFTILLKISTLFISVPPAFWTYLSGAIVMVVGVVMLFPALYDRIAFFAKANRETSKLMSAGFMKQSFAGDVLVGAALGPIFSTCSPTYFIVLASVLPVNLALGLFDIVAYIIGLCASLLLISFVGQRIMARLSIAANPGGWIKRTVGALFVLIGLLIITGIDAKIEAPLYQIFDETMIEQRLLGGTSDTPSVSSAGLADKTGKYRLAPELASPDAYLNTAGKPIRLAQYRGKNVVLLDFWTYSCINCQRTLPYLTTWYEKYKDQGLVIIGVHTPEFAFEHVEANVAAALKELGIDYPVVLDNEYKTWNAYGNQYWPHDYVIDMDGFITHDHIGEGGYAETEEAIQAALAERAERLGAPSEAVAITPDIPSADAQTVGSPETYFGSARNQYLGNGRPGAGGTHDYTLPPAPLLLNTLYLGGSWNIEPEYAESASETVIKYDYDARDVYFVASSDAPVQVDVYLDGKPAGSLSGADVDPRTSSATIQAERLYRLIHAPDLGEHTLELRVHGAGLRAYTFTFG